MSAILILCALLVLVFADATSVKTANGLPSMSLPWHSSAIITTTSSATIDTIVPAFLQSQLLVTTTTPTTGTSTPIIVRSTPTVTTTTPTTATTAPTIVRSTPTVTTTIPTTATTATVDIRSTPIITTTTPTTATTAPTIVRSTPTVTTTATTATVDIRSTPTATTTTPCPVSVDTNGHRVKEGQEVGWESRLLMFVLGAATFVIMVLLWWYVKQRRANVQCKNPDKHEAVNTPTVGNYGVNMTPVTYENDSDTRDSNSSSE